ncbi:hypothetical protein [Aliiroseovarius crassostreae]|uniref:hypothetical protein n=1 Tax=Aliiroseovarius crassostreae TaxID=154981 RepID=UPI0011146CF6|nr:hypothetical protein [Aliiroseovarius crassostreae]
MQFQSIPLKSLSVNKANDRHGPEPSEDAAIAWLFTNKGKHMLALATDIAKQGRILNAPLVKPNGRDFVVHDGNRRVTCLKLINDPERTPQAFRAAFRKLSEQFSVSENYQVDCQVETDQSLIDVTLSRRHNGTDGGRGQLDWDTRAKANHANRVGGTNQYPIAEAIEGFLKAEGFTDAEKVGRSTLYRLVNAKKRQSLIGVSLTQDSKLKLERPKDEVLTVLTKIANDIISKDVTLKRILDSEGVDSYFEELRQSGLLSTPHKHNSNTSSNSNGKAPQKKSPPRRDTLIPNSIASQVQWKPRQGKIQRLWEELQFKLTLSRHELTIAIAFRVLIELTTNQYLNLKGISLSGKLAKDVRSATDDLKAAGKITDKELRDLHRVSNDTSSPRELEALNRVIHSSSFSMSREDLIGLWDSFEHYLIECIRAD